MIPFQDKWNIHQLTRPFPSQEKNLVMKKKDNPLRFGLFVIFIRLEKPIK